MEGMRDSDLGWYMGMSKIVGKNVGGGDKNMYCKRQTIRKL